MRQSTIERCEKVKFILDNNPDKKITDACKEVGIEREPYYQWAKKFKLTPGKIKKGKKLIKKMQEKIKTSDCTIDPTEIFDGYNYKKPSNCTCPDNENLKEEISTLKNTIDNQNEIILSFKKEIQTLQDHRDQLIANNKQIETEKTSIIQEINKFSAQIDYWKNRSERQSELISGYLLEGFINGTFILKYEKAIN